MEIVDFEKKYSEKYFLCLEDWSEEMKEAGNHKALWFDKMKEKGLRIKIALENDCVIGMIQYIPIEYSFADGKDLYFINCIWVHGYKQGVGNHQKKGVGKSLLEAAENDAKSKKSKGIAAWGVSLSPSVSDSAASRKSSPRSWNWQATSRLDWWSLVWAYSWRTWPRPAAA